MFTPQRKAWSQSLRSAEKGKAVAFADDPPPPLSSLSVREDKTMVRLDAGNIEDWKKFKEVGLLDEAVMQRKDYEAFVDKVSRLERELFDYQHNMGLLLIEKREWGSKYEELSQELVEIEEILKREQSAHLIALSEVEEREEFLRKALSTEKQCVGDLERALRGIQEEHAQIQCSSQTKLAEAKTLAVGIEEKSSVVDKKLYNAEAKLSEINRKSAELDMKLREVEARESLLQKERLSLDTDREAFEATFYKQREDLKEWEMKLRQREEMLDKGRQNANEREEKVTEMEKNLKKKERELALLEKKFQSSNSSMKEKDIEISRRLADLDAEEKKSDSLKSTLEMKEKELLALELKLSAREKEGIQKLLGEQKDVLDLKLHELEMEMEQKQKSLDEEFRSKIEALGQREVEINHREKKLEKEEQALSKKVERVKEQSKELESQLKSLKVKEKIMKTKEKDLEKEKRQVLADGESLENLKGEIETIKAEISQQELQICKESEELKITREERSEHYRLQLELKQEIENTMLQREFLIKEAENLKQERERFEKEWEVLDEKKTDISRLQKEIDVENEKLRKLRHTEEERLKKEKQDVQEYIKKELEELELEKESFTDFMRHEKLVLSEKAKSDHAKMLEDFEKQRRILENEIQKKEDVEKSLQERERAFQEEMQRERNNIDVLKDVTEKKWEEVRSERHRLEDDKKEVELGKQQLADNRRDMLKDSDELMKLSRKVKKERESLVAKKNHFLQVVEKLRSCKGCEEVIKDLVVSDLQLPEYKEREAVSSPTSPLQDEMILNNSLGNIDPMGSNYSGSVKPVSWLRKCTSIFKLSPSKTKDGVGASVMTKLSPLSDVKFNTEGPESLGNVEGTKDVFENEPQPSGGISHGYSSPTDDHSYMDSLAEDSQQSVPKSSRHKPGRKNKSGISRTRSVKAVVEDAKKFLGKAPDEDSGYTEKTGRKRQRAQTSRVTESEQDFGDSEAQSDSVTAGGRRKKRQTIAPPVQVTGERRYNLRRHKIADKVASSNGTKTVGNKATGGKPEAVRSPEAVSGPSSALVADDIVQTTVQVEVSTVKNVISDDRVVRFEIPNDMVDDNGDAAKSAEQIELSEEVNGTEEQDVSIINEVENDYEEEGPEEEEEDEDDDEEEHPGEVSIGKKIFKFLIT
ncbi:hypothetical protein L6164_001799 [Bauhinia variegata]|uniref:Uncharacterized protein n=1 Tax=Bauhinia variegata TaxID=167791 RepID=A0ACB9QA48_BAUVA|nr:hypothetical protein L6164_001799 [Bauhinia variegata]